VQNASHCPNALDIKSHMEYISLAAAITLTEWSERTFYRKFADRSIVRQTEGGRTSIAFDSIQPFLCIPLATADILLVHQANTGLAVAQTELALLFLENNKVKSAMYWLDMAAKQDDADAAHWLGRCYIDGNGFEKDDNLGIMWLAKAASLGHIISMQQVLGIRTAHAR